MKVYYVKTVEHEFYTECNIKNEKRARKEVLERHGLAEKDVVKFERREGLE